MREGRCSTTCREERRLSSTVSSTNRGQAARAWGQSAIVTVGGEIVYSFIVGNR